MSIFQSLKGGGRHGVPASEQRDPIGYAVALVNRVASSDLLDRIGVRRQAEQTVFRLTSGGFRVASAAGRTWKKVGSSGKQGVRVPGAGGDGVFDLTPSED